MDILISLGMYNSRSEALRELIRPGIKSLKGIFEVAGIVMKPEVQGPLTPSMSNTKPKS